MLLDGISLANNIALIFKLWYLTKNKKITSQEYASYYKLTLNSFVLKCVVNVR